MGDLLYGIIVIHIIKEVFMVIKKRKIRFFHFTVFSCVFFLFPVLFLTFPIDFLTFLVVFLTFLAVVSYFWKNGKMKKS